MELSITKYVELREDRVWFNGAVDYSAGSGTTGDFLRSVYGHYRIDYPKFFKMDNLCKLAFLNAEILLKDAALQKYRGEDVAIILENASSSLESDEKHRKSIRDRSRYFPSPSVFVYTIPNLMAAEIAIRHQVKGENAVFISERFDPGLIHRYVSELFRGHGVKACLSGWVECDGDRFQSFLFIVEPEQDTEKLKDRQEYVSFNITTLERLFKTKIL